jgi:hypothetical protein
VLASGRLAASVAVLGLIAGVVSADSHRTRQPQAGGFALVSDTVEVAAGHDRTGGEKG